MATVLVKGGRIVTEVGVVEAEVLIEDGKIGEVKRTVSEAADRVIHAEGKFIMPGIVDAHAHIYDPAYTNREDFAAGSAAAAAGGVTTIIEMVLQTPVDSPERVMEKVRHGERNSIVDFSLHAGMMNASNMKNVSSICRLGVKSFKAFMCKPYYILDDVLSSLMGETASNDAITNVHAEDEELANRFAERLISEGRRDPLAHAEWKPNIVEATAIRKAIDFASKTGSRLHISHMSTAEGTALVKEAKARGARVTAETCPHYLTFTREDMRGQGPYLKVNPPLKAMEDVEALWRGLLDGSVDMVTSEHAPGERWEKDVGWTDIWQAWGGVPSIETVLPVILSHGVNKRMIPLETVVKVLCGNPARTFGLYPVKGALRPGSDADLVIFDLNLEKKVRAEELHYKVGWTPYEGWTLKGWPVLTMVRGAIVAEKGEVRGKPGYGRFVSMRELGWRSVIV